MKISHHFRQLAPVLSSENLLLNPVRCALLCACDCSLLFILSAKGSLNLPLLGTLNIGRHQFFTLFFPRWNTSLSEAVCILHAPPPAHPSENLLDLLKFATYSPTGGHNTPVSHSNKCNYIPLNAGCAFANIAHWVVSLNDCWGTKLT